MNNKKGGMNVSTATSRRRDSRSVGAEPVNDGEKSQEMIRSHIPQLCLAPDGKFTIDHKSLTIVTTEDAENMRKLASTQAIVEDGNHVGVNIRKGKASKRWYAEETEHFLEALKMVGLNFTHMAMTFPNRNRTELQRKYKKEASFNPNLLAEILENKTPLDVEKLKAGPRKIEVSSQPEPGSGKKVASNVGKPTQRKKDAKQKQKAQVQAPTPRKREASSKQTDDSVGFISGPPKKKLKTGENPSTFLPVPQKVVSHQSSQIIPTISNIQATCHLGTEIDLTKVIQLFNADYNPSCPSWITLYLPDPKSTARVLFNGKVICMGTTTLESARHATRIVARLVQACGIPQVKYSKFKVHNIVATYRTNFYIKLDELFNENRGVCRYQPEIFPGARWGMKDPKGDFTIFTDGSIILAGGKTMIGVNTAFGKIVKIVEQYKK